MFFLTRSIFGLPLMFLFWLGKPFHWEAPSSLRNISPSTLKSNWNEKKIEHYLPRLFMAFVAAVVCLLCLGAWYFVPEIMFDILALVAIVSVSIDSMMLLGRIKYHKELKRESGSTELVLQEHWKDSSLKAILQRQKDEIRQWKEQHEPRKEAHGLHVISQG